MRAKYTKRCADVSFLLSCLLLCAIVFLVKVGIPPPGSPRFYFEEKVALRATEEEVAPPPPAPTPPPPPPPPIYCGGDDDILDPDKALAAIAASAAFFANPQAPIQKSRGHAQFDMMGPVADPCRLIESFGSGDEEKAFCARANRTATSATSATSACTAFSIGSKNEWEFERDIALRTPCFIHTFDCTLMGPFAPPPELAGRSKQHRLCAGDPRRQDYMTLGQLAGVTEAKTVDYLKMDIEGSEWGVLRDMLDAKDARPLPSQIAVEVHTFGGKTNQQLFCMMASLFREGGYVLAARRDNRRCSGCSEILLVRARCVEADTGRHASCVGELMF